MSRNSTFIVEDGYGDLHQLNVCNDSCIRAHLCTHNRAPLNPCRHGKSEKKDYSAMYHHKPPEPCTLTSPIPLNSDSVNDDEQAQLRSPFPKQESTTSQLPHINSQSQESTGWHVLIK